MSKLLITFLSLATATPTLVSKTTLGDIPPLDQRYTRNLPDCIFGHRCFGMITGGICFPPGVPCPPNDSLTSRALDRFPSVKETTLMQKQSPETLVALTFPCGEGYIFCGVVFGCIKGTYPHCPPFTQSAAGQATPSPPEEPLMTLKKQSPEAKCCKPGQQCVPGADCCPGFSWPCHYAPGKMICCVTWRYCPPVCWSNNAAAGHATPNPPEEPLMALTAQTKVRSCPDPLGWYCDYAHGKTMCCKLGQSCDPKIGCADDSPLPVVQEEVLSCPDWLKCLVPSLGKTMCCRPGQSCITDFGCSDDSTLPTPLPMVQDEVLNCPIPGTRHCDYAPGKTSCCKAGQSCVQDAGCVAETRYCPNPVEWYCEHAPQKASKCCKPGQRCVPGYGCSGSVQKDEESPLTVLRNYQPVRFCDEGQHFCAKYFLNGNWGCVDLSVKCSSSTQTAAVQPDVVVLQKDDSPLTVLRNYQPVRFCDEGQHFCAKYFLNGNWGCVDLSVKCSSSTQTAAVQPEETAMVLQQTAGEVPAPALPAGLPIHQPGMTWMMCLPFGLKLCRVQTVGFCWWPALPCPFSVPPQGGGGGIQTMSPKPVVTLSVQMPGDPFNADGSADLSPPQKQNRENDVLVRLARDTVGTQPICCLYDPACCI